MSTPIKITDEADKVLGDAGDHAADAINGGQAPELAISTAILCGFRAICLELAAFRIAYEERNPMLSGKAKDEFLELSKKEILRRGLRGWGDKLDGKDKP